ncbi:MAG: IclR family transcriptional regulator [Chloroflexi bacterium]|nr:IclR family transcriptional regulator [Chloroflexota bacterium]
MKNPNIYRVRVMERAMQILDCFDDEHPERGVSEIAQLVGLHKATTHRIIVSLMNGGFLERATDGERYRLGLRLAELGMAAIRTLDFRREAIPHMKALVDRFEETCDLSVFDRGEVFYVEVIQGKHTLTIAARVGMRLPAHCTASGKTFLAFMPEAEARSILKEPLTRYTDWTITSAEQVWAQLAEVRARGYGYDDQEFEIGIRAVAAPIRNREGKVIAVISMPGPTSRMTPERVSEIAESIVAAARAISTRLGWQG